MEETRRESPGGSEISIVRSEKLYDPLQLKNGWKIVKYQVEPSSVNNQACYGGEEDAKNLLVKIAKPSV